MSFCLRPIVCKKCGKPLTLFEGRICLECAKAEQELIITTAGVSTEKMSEIPTGSESED